MHTVDNVAQQLIDRLKRNPQDGAAHRALRVHYQAQGDTAAVVRLLQDWAAQHQDDHAIAAPTLAEAGQLARQLATHEPTEGSDETQLHRQSAELFGEALALEPLCHEAIAGKLALLHDLRQYQEAGVFLSGHISRIQSLVRPGTEQLLAELYQELGQLLQQKLRAPGAAATCFERATQLRQAAQCPTLQPIEAHSTTEPPTAMDEEVTKHALPDSIAQARSSHHAPDPPTTTVGPAPANVVPEGDRNTQQTRASKSDAATATVRIHRYLEQANQQFIHQQDLNGAIGTLRTALDEISGDVHVMHQLAIYLLERAQRPDNPDSDRDLRRAAELFYQIGLGIMYHSPADSLTYLESALAVEPTHASALDLAEQLAPTCGQEQRLPPLWVAFLAHAGLGPQTNRRRLALANAYIQAGQTEDAIYCLEQLPAHGEAATLLNSLLSRGRRPTPVIAGRARSSTHTTATDRRPTLSMSRRAGDAARIAYLKKEAQAGQATNDLAIALDRYMAVLRIDPTDSEALPFVEHHHRSHNNYRALRDLLLASTRIAAGQPTDVRRRRLLEVAQLSEHHLGELDEAISALKAMVNLNPTDGEATRDLRRLLETNQQWDDLVELLERATLSETSPTSKASMLAELAHVHLNQRADPSKCVAVLLQLVQLEPQNTAARDQVCTLLMELERFAEAVPFLRQQAESITDPAQRRDKLRELLHTAEQLGEDDQAYQLCRELLELSPEDAHSLLQVMAELESRRGDEAALCATLERRAQILSAGPEQAATFLQIGALRHALGDQDAARDAYIQALYAAPTDPSPLQPLTELFASADLLEDLEVLLEEHGSGSGPVPLRSACYRQLGIVRRDLQKEHEGASAAFEKLVALEDDLDALNYLAARACHNDIPEQQAAYLWRAQALIDDPEQRRDQLFELALLQRDELSSPEAAQRSLCLLLRDVAPTYGPAAQALRQLAEQTGEPEAKAHALGAQLRMVGSSDHQQALRLAKALADIAPASDTALMALALRRWAELDPNDVSALRRLASLLVPNEDPSDYLQVVDQWASRTLDETQQTQAKLLGAQVCFAHLNDPAGAWIRLQHLVEHGCQEAEALLLEVCREHGWIDRLINLHVTVARQPEVPSPEQARRWLLATTLWRDELQDLPKAIEGAVRALACDLHNGDLLALLEDLCTQAQARQRLRQVYERLLKATPDPARRCDLLLRLAERLERGFTEPGDAFNCVARAWDLAVTKLQLSTIVDRLQRLAIAAGRHAELLHLYDTHLPKAANADQRVYLLLHAATFCREALQDKARSQDYVLRALSAVGNDLSRWELVWTAAATLDAPAPRLELLDNNGLDEQHSTAPEADRTPPPVYQRALCDEHLRLARQSDRDTASFLVAQAAKACEAHLQDPLRALTLMCAGVGLLPFDGDLYGTCLALATRLGHIQTLEVQLKRFVHSAIDSSVAILLLQRQGALLEGPLARLTDAAAVYEKLLQLQPNDAQVAEKLRAALRGAGRYQELLIAIHRRLQRTTNEQERLELLKEAALAWDEGLDNRFEALETWQKVCALSPTDDDARHAISRLSQRIIGPSPSVEELLAPTDSDIPKSYAELHRRGPRASGIFEQTPKEPAVADPTEQPPSSKTTLPEPVPCSASRNQESRQEPAPDYPGDTYPAGPLPPADTAGPQHSFPLLDENDLLDLEWQLDALEASSAETISSHLQSPHTNAPHHFGRPSRGPLRGGKGRGNGSTPSTAPPPPTQLYSRNGTSRRSDPIQETPGSYSGPFPPEESP